MQERKGKKTTDKITPTDIGMAKYSRIGKLSDCQRRIYMLIINRSAQGLWTNYEEINKTGVKSPTRRMHELTGKKFLNIAKRQTKGVRKSDGGCIDTPEFCVYK